ncbi:sigma-70 family RNA polymerase sigma factor [uncultured Croceitalea sp.]|uniref:RNA polymerase sigma factor n=1 Tax=uncultured Croceitalea sp. TaxID=1798908 RepID=UPI003305998D
MSTKKDTEILHGFITGNSLVLREIYSRHFPEVKSYIVKNSGTENDAKDIFQDALVITYQKLKSDSLNLECSLATYIFAVSRNLWMNSLRKRKKTISVDAVLDISVNLEKGILYEIERQERVSLYQKHFLKLGENCQQVLKHFFLGKKMQEIASLMDYTHAYTRKKKFECKKKLLEMIEADPVYSELQLKNLKSKAK